MAYEKQPLYSDYDLQRLKNIERYNQLYDGDAYKVFDVKGYFDPDSRQNELYYMNVNIPSLISDYFADEVSGKEIFIDVDDEESQKIIDKFVKESNLDLVINETALTQSKDGYTAWRIRKNNDDVCLDQIPNSQFFPVFSNDVSNEMKEVRIISVVTITFSQFVVKKCAYVEHYFYSDDENGEKKPYLLYELWELDGSYNIIAPLDISNYSQELSNEPIKLNTKSIPIYQINNTKKSENNYGISDYEKVLDLFDELNNRHTQISVQLLKHLNARLTVPVGTLDENGNVVSGNFEMIEIPTGVDAPKYITNENPQIENGFKQIEHILKMISAITHIPSAIFGIEPKGGVEKVEGMKIREYPLIRKVERKRTFMGNAIKRMIEDVLLLNEKEIPEGFKVKIEWDEILPEDSFSKLLSTEKELALGLVSHRTVLKRDYGMDDEAIEKELEAIKKEKDEEAERQLEAQQRAFPNSAKIVDGDAVRESKNNAQQRTDNKRIVKEKPTTKNRDSKNNLRTNRRITK